MRITQRIKTFIEKKGLTVAAFERSIGLSNATFSKSLKNGGALGSDKLEKILSIYPELSPEWLLTGRGEMLVQTEGAPTLYETVQKHTSRRKAMPYYDVDFVGGFDDLFNDQTTVPDSYLDVPGFDRVDFWCNVRGTSMHPLIKHGDLIALREIPFSSIRYGDIYAVVLDGTRTIKQIRRAASDEMLRFIPINTIDYDEQEYDKREIIRVFEVMGTISKFF